MDTNLQEQKKPGWYHSTWALVVAIATVGPLALPLVWTNARYKLGHKIGISIFIVFLTVATIMASVETLKWAKGYMEEIQRAIDYGQGK